MDASESGFLYALAAISITFVGFSAVVMVLRQTAGGEITKYDSYFVLAFMQAGFIVVGGALLPALLSLYGLPPIQMWRLASVICAVPVFLFVCTVPARRKAAVREGMPVLILVLLLLQLVAGIYLLLNALGWPLSPGAGAYAAALTDIFVTSAVAYLVALGSVFKRHARRP